MKFCSSCGKKVSTTREDDEIESCNICGKVLAFPGLRANPRFINGECRDYYRKSQVKTFHGKDCMKKEQAARETAAAAAKEAWEENFKNCPEELQAAAKEREAAIENFKKGRQH
ncbi:uncharacterized protein [Populus alba]|uniref:uncharacterized protein isoform X4 n=1 Tax=Populus alba TaxID=43335 RepID=UPI00158D79BB|nr:uncharacterized protein LOC118042425 isoform X2 [Populus alba]